MTDGWQESYDVMDGCGTDDEFWAMRSEVKRWNMGQLVSQLLRVMIIQQVLGGTLEGFLFYLLVLNLLIEKIIKT